MSYLPRMQSITRAVLVLALLLVPAISLAQGSIGVVQSNSGGTFGMFYSTGGVGTGYGVCTTSLCSVGQNLVYIINSVLVPVLFAIAFIVFLYGIAKAYIFSSGNEEAVKEGHKLLLWGIIAFVVMVSLWGIVNVFADTFGLSGYYAPQTPSSVSPYDATVPAAGTTNGTAYVQQPFCNSAGKCFNAYGNPTN